MSPGIIRGALRWSGKKKYLGRNNRGARKLIRTPRLRKIIYKWQNKKKEKKGQKKFAFVLENRNSSLSLHP